MEIRFKGRTFHTAEMLQFETGVEAIPFILVDKSGVCFLKRLQPEGKGPTLVHLNPILLADLVRDQHLEDLKSYLQQLRVST